MAATRRSDADRGIFSKGQYFSLGKVSQRHVNSPAYCPNLFKLSEAFGFPVAHGISKVQVMVRFVLSRALPIYGRG